MKKWFMIVLVIGSAVVTTVAIWALGSLILPVLFVRAANAGLPCEGPPEGFSQTDLVGTWEAGVPEQRDTLILREDGKYRQLVHVQLATRPPVDYESDWQEWWLENQDNGIPYLHLEGMRLCGFNPELSCGQAGGGGHDFCRNTSLKMSGEGILLVLGVPRPIVSWPGSTFAARGISLMLPAGSENSWGYTLKDP